MGMLHNSGQNTIYQKGLRYVFNKKRKIHESQEERRRNVVKNLCIANGLETVPENETIEGNSKSTGNIT